MFSFIVRQVFWTIPLLIGVTVTVFLILHLTPGDPAAILLGESADQASIERLREEMGLNKPLPVQYGIFVSDVVRGDLGTSTRSRRPVIDELADRLPATLELAAAALAIAVVVGMSVGVIAAVKQYSVFDNASMLFALTFASMPSFWFGLLLMLVFSVQLGWLPPVGRGGFANLILPAITLAAVPAALIARLTRSAMLEVIHADYVRTARAKGVHELLITQRHALRNALIPIVTAIGLQFGTMMGGSVVVETVFAWPGIGRLMVNSILTKDFPIVQGGLLVMALVVTAINLLVDLLYGLINPRIRYS